jgi:hypothetical protein
MSQKIYSKTYFNDLVSFNLYENQKNTWSFNSTYNRILINEVYYGKE